MADLKHIKTFESYATPAVEEEELNEGVFDALKTKIDKYLDDPKEGKEDKLLGKAFSKAFASAPKTKADVLALDFKEKVAILKKASIKLADPKIGVLKIMKRGGAWDVGGVPLVAGTGGGRKG
jgi:hypothetical protein